MTRRHPFPAPRARHLVLLLAWLMAAPASADQHTPAAPETGAQALEKIVEARGRARDRSYAEALSQLQEAVSLARGMADKLPLALALHNTAEVQLLRGEPLDALKAFYQALEVYTQLGHRTGVDLVEQRIGTVTRLFRKPQEPAAPVAAATPPPPSPEAPAPPETPTPPEVPAPAEAPAPVPPEAQLSPIDLAVERIRQRRQAPAAPPGPVQVTPSRKQAAEDPREQAYVEILRRKISNNSRYPDYARRTGQEGTVDLAFVVGENGEVESVELLKSSGFILLDVEALRNVRESAPFSPAPQGSAPGFLTVRMTFRYQLPAAPGRAP